MTESWKHEDFISAAIGYENEPEGGARCSVCFRMRLYEAAIFAKQNGFEFTFTISEEDHKALVNVSVYGKFGKTNKILRNTLKNMISYFSKK